MQSIISHSNNPITCISHTPEVKHSINKKHAIHSSSPQVFNCTTVNFMWIHKYITLPFNCKKKIVGQQFHYFHKNKNSRINSYLIHTMWKLMTDVDYKFILLNEGQLSFMFILCGYYILIHHITLTYQFHMMCKLLSK